MFAVVVTFQIHDGAVAEFLPAMIENARTSLAQEEGCQQFDVCTDESRPNEVFLYEVYADRAAFEVHLESAHFKAFDQRVGALVRDKTVLTYGEVKS